MKLAEVYKNILKEEEVEAQGVDPTTGANVIELPNLNMTISLFPDKKQLLFAPQSHASMPNKVRELVNQLKEKFKISNIEQTDMSSFLISIDPIEDFDSVVAFIRQDVQENGNY